MCVQHHTTNSSFVEEAASDANIHPLALLEYDYYLPIYNDIGQMPGCYLHCDSKIS